jgi:hypothetical protein
MTGSFAGLIGSVKKVVASGLTNLFPNGDFTSTDITGWNIGQRTTSLFYSSPASLLAPAVGEADPQIYYSNAGILTIAQPYSLSFWLRADGVDPITFYFYVGSTLQTIIITPSTIAWVYYKIENVICATNTTVQLNASGPWQFYIDDIWLVAGATAH